MATVTTLLPTHRVDLNELTELCWRLQAIGIHAVTGHSGPYGSISIDNEPADHDTARKIVAAYEDERSTALANKQPTA